MLQALHKEIKNDGDWVVYEDLEDFKEQFCSWVDASIGEGLSDDSKVLSLKKDGRIYFNFELGYGIGSIPEELKFNATSTTGKTQSTTEEIPNIPGVNPGGGILIGNVGFGISF